MLVSSPSGAICGRIEELLRHAATTAVTQLRLEESQFLHTPLYTVQVNFLYLNLTIGVQRTAVEPRHHCPNVPEPDSEARTRGAGLGIDKEGSPDHLSKARARPGAAIAGKGSEEKGRGNVPHVPLELEIYNSPPFSQPRRTAVCLGTVREIEM
ncbi:hypothetical protein J6590_057729 [Homalodisca vitripennis]|nr:hypothetical protein J6590_057729 [Homalodisca vitripennis]